MSTSLAKNAIKTLIDANSATLLSGLTAQGQARTIEHLTTSIMTPATGYFFIAIHAVESRGHSYGGVNAARPPRRIEYDMVVHIEDYAVGTTGEDEVFETAHGNFDTFVDRIATLVEGQNWLPDGTSSPRYRLVRSTAPIEDRVITRSDATQGQFDEAERFHAMLYSQLRFRIEEC